MKTFRRVCLWLHRELGFLAVGLTLVYAISGLAVNHAHHWNPNYTQSRDLSRMEAVGAGPTAEITPRVLARLALPADEVVKNTWRSAPDKLQVFVEGATYTVNLEDGGVRRDGIGRRAALYEMNFMHLNTGKGLWTGVADAFAGVMIVLAITGIFLVKGAKGLKGRGGVLMGLGILLPILYALSSEVF